MMRVLCLLIAAMRYSMAIHMHTDTDAVSRNVPLAQNDIANGKSNFTVLPDAKVTYSQTFCCDEVNLTKHIYMSMRNLRFCFDRIHVLIDVPHGGHIHHGVWAKWIPGGLNGYEEFMTSDSGQQLIASAKKAAQEGAAILEENCPNAPTWEVEVAKYDDAMRDLVKEDLGWNPNASNFPELYASEADLDLEYYCSVVPMSSNNYSFMFDRMYANTMMYLKLMHLPGNPDYVYHGDSQVIEISPVSFNAIEKGIKLMRADDRVASTVVYPPWRFKTEEIRKRFVADFVPRWNHATAPVLTYGQGGFSARNFMMDVKRMKGLRPFQMSCTMDAAEHIFSRAYREKSKYQAWFANK